MKKYIYKIRYYIVAQLIFNALATIALAICPYITKILFDSVAKNRGIEIFYLIIIYIGCYVVNLIFSYLEMLNSWKGGVRFELFLKKDFFRAVSNYSYARFIKKDVGEYISLQGNEITQLESDYLTPILDIFKSINIFIIYGITFFALIDWRISIMMISLSILSTLVAPNITSVRLSDRRKIYLDQMGQYVAKIKDFLDGFKIIKTTTRDKIIDEQEKYLKETADKRFQYGKLKTLSYAINGGFTYLLHVSAFAMVSYLLYRKQITLGTAVATFGYLECFISPIQSLTYDINTINSTKSIKGKVFEFMKYDTPAKDISQKSKFNSFIDFKDVTVKYENFSLKDFSYKFEKGKKYALIGHSGSGKSTILNSLAKYIKLNSGHIEIDGEDIRKIDISKIVTYINQNEHIFADNYINNTTIYGAYKYKNVDFIKEKLENIALSSIMKRENCQMLSGGEKQVISIIRMFQENSPICILDEVFSATDMNTTKKLQKILTSMDDKTIIMVTHKLSEDLKEFDEILLMEDGKLILSGTYDEISKSPKFIKLKSA